jgi:sn-glycerol 3-phosphate transport system substrate-binding protein
MTAAPGASDVPGDAAKIGISVWLSDYRSAAHRDQPELAVTAAAEFNQAHPEYRVEIKSQAFRTLPARVIQAAERGEQPDVAELEFSVTQPALDALGRDGAPLFTPVERAIAGRTEILGEAVVLGDMVPAVRDYFRHTGELAAVTRTASTVLLYANMDILARAGVAEPPRTWRDVLAACRAVAALPAGPPACITWPNHYWFFLQAVAQQGGLITDRQNGRLGRAEQVSLDSAEMMAFVAWWRRLHQDGYYRYTGKPYDFPGCFEAFENQQVALVLSSSVDAPHMRQRGQRRGFAVEAGRMPYNDEVRLAGNTVGAHSLWLTAGLSPEKQDGALAFMQYLISPRHAAEWAKLQTRVPVTRAAASLLDREGWLDRNPDFRAATGQLEGADGSAAALGPVLGGYAAMVDEIHGAMHDVLTAEAEPAARFTQASATAQQALDAYNSYCAGPPRRTPCDLTVR